MAVASAGPRPDEHDALPARSWFRLLVDPTFGPYILGRTLSSGGIWIYHIVVVVLAYERTRSAFVVGLVGVAQFVPQLVLAPLSGAMADRGSRKRQAIAGRFLVAGGAIGLAVWWQNAEFSDRTAAVGLIVSAFVVGLGFVTGGPAMHALVPSLVRRSEIAAAVTLNTAPVTVARVLGPVVGTAITVAFGPGAALYVAAACNIGFAVALMPLTIPQPPPAPRAERTVLSGFAYLREHRGGALILLGVAIVGMASDPAITLAPSIADELGRPTTFAGTVTTAFGVGAGLAFLVIPMLHRWMGVGRSGSAGLLLMAVGFGALVVLVPLGAEVPSLGVLGVAGLGMTVAITSLSSRLQAQLPEEMRGRIMALWSMCYLGSRPVAAAIDGALADAFSVGVALAVIIVLLLSAAWLSRPGPQVRAEVRGGMPATS